VPHVGHQVALQAVFESMENAIALMCVEPAATRAIVDVMTIERPSRAVAIVGPEGGWSAPELDLAERQGARFLTLGPRTLRAETAPAVLLAALWTAWGW
jgi:16S rRNA (uracil1498-N3)-methyltransferase